MITTTIPAEFEPFIEHQLATGRYKSPQEVVSDALRLLCEQGLETLQKEIQVGIDQLDRGEEIIIESEEALQRFFDDIEKEGEKEIEAERRDESLFRLAGSTDRSPRNLEAHRRHNQPAANRLRGRFQEVLIRLGRNPLMGQACDNLRSRSRFRVLHGARDTKSMF